MSGKMKTMSTLFLRWRSEIAFLLIVIAGVLIPRIPYFNIYMTGIMSVLVTLAVLIKTGFNDRNIYIATLALLMFSIFVTFADDGIATEYLANVIFFILIVGAAVSAVNISRRKETP